MGEEDFPDDKQTPDFTNCDDTIDNVSSTCFAIASVILNIKIKMHKMVY